MSLVLVAAATGASTKDYSGPSCNNFTGGDGQYATNATGDAVLSWAATTESPTCAKTPYSLFVLTGLGGTLITSQAVQGGTSMACPNGAPASTSCISWSIDLGPAATTAPSSICIYGTSTWANKVSDRAPDAAGSCIPLAINGGTGATGYN